MSKMISCPPVSSLTTELWETTSYGFKRPQYSKRRLIADSLPFVFQLSKLYQKILLPFVQARMTHTATSKTIKLPLWVGKFIYVERTLEKLKSNLDATLDSKEDCLLLCAYQLCSVVNLPLKVESLDTFESNESDNTRILNTENTITIMNA